VKCRRSLSRTDVVCQWCHAPASLNEILLSTKKDFSTGVYGRDGDLPPAAPHNQSTGNKKPDCRWCFRGEKVRNRRKKSVTSSTHKNRKSENRRKSIRKNAFRLVRGETHHSKFESVRFSEIPWRFTEFQSIHGEKWICSINEFLFVSTSFVSTNNCYVPATYQIVYFRVLLCSLCKLKMFFEINCYNGPVRSRNKPLHVNKPRFVRFVGGTNRNVKFRAFELHGACAVRFDQFSSREVFVFTEARKSWAG